MLEEHLKFRKNTSDLLLPADRCKWKPEKYIRNDCHIGLVECQNKPGIEEFNSW